MKILVRALSLALIAVLLCLSLVACSKRFEDGEYTLDGDHVLSGAYDAYVFDGRTFTYTSYTTGFKPQSQISGKYKLEVIEQEDEEDQLEDEENGITRGTITFTFTDESGATVTRTLPFIYDEYECVVSIGGHLMVSDDSGEYGYLHYTLNDAGEE